MLLTCFPLSASSSDFSLAKSLFSADAMVDGREKNDYGLWKVLNASALFA
jgi:hypothetical protein